MTKKIILELDFGKYVHCLYNIPVCWKNNQEGLNILKVQNTNFKHMYFFDRYLEAKVFQSLAKKHKFESGLWSDENSEGELVVTTNFELPVPNSIAFIKD